MVPTTEPIVTSTVLLLLGVKGFQQPPESRPKTLLNSAA